MSNTEPTASPIQVVMVSDPSPQVCFSDHARLEFLHYLRSPANKNKKRFSQEKWIGFRITLQIGSNLFTILNRSSNLTNRNFSKIRGGNLKSSQGNQMEAYSLHDYHLKDGFILRNAEQDTQAICRYKWYVACSQCYKDIRIYSGATVRFHP